MGTYSLVCHPASPARDVKRIEVKWQALPTGRLMLRWQVHGARSLVVPAFAGKGRADGLWQATCFELFLKGAGRAYREYNFSPSQRWAAYGFATYREGTSLLDLAEPPEISCGKGDQIFAFTAMLPQTILTDATRAGITAVIEEDGGQMSYWALAHAPGPPDFHRDEGFTIAVAEAA